MSEALSLSSLPFAIPDAPRSQRPTRYRGEDRGVPMHAMAPPERDAVRTLYASVTDLLGALEVARDDAEVDAAVVRFDESDVVAVARRIGLAPTDERMRQALHDVRGGALTSLLLLVRRRRMRPGSVDARALRVLASDHLKVMRNAVLELDDPARDADLAPRPHSIERLVDTLARVTSDHASVRLDCTFRGTISMSCMEMGTLDRATLNVVNNAVRHAARDPVEVQLAPDRDAADAGLRMLSANAVDPAHARALRERFGGDDVSRLFVDRFSTTGSGEGMHVCAELVAAAYGVARTEDGIALGLVGARLVEDTFVSWMHWPAVV